MMAGSFHRVAFTLLLGMTAAAAQESLETRGVWRLVADGADFALRTQARDAADSTLSLHCRKAQKLYAFEIKSPALAARQSGEDIRLGYKVDGDDQTWFNLATGPDGTVPISHQTAFRIIQAALTRDGAKRVSFTAADHAWQFDLDGLRDLTQSLTERCGFDPTPPEPEGQQMPPTLPRR